MSMGRRADIGAGQLPGFVQITRAFPQTAAGKGRKRDQARSRPGPGPAARPEYRLLTDRGIAGIRAESHRGGRLHLLERS